MARKRARAGECAQGAGAAALPAGFRERMESLLGDGYPDFEAAAREPAAGLRVNTLRLTPDRFREIAPFAVTPLAYPPEGFVVEDEARPGRHPYHAAGMYYLQDPGAMVVGALVDPQPGDRVLDLAAAPGGKATHLAARMRSEGVLVANDVHPGRARELAGNLERLGVRNAVVTSEPVERLATRLEGHFHRVLLDAPCSGESMFHKSEAARAEWSPAAVQGCARRQGDLLSAAARAVGPGGVLVYSTCTFSPEENEGAIDRFLGAHRDFQVEALSEVPGGEPGRPDWVEGGRGDPRLARTLRLWPHRVAGAGHFVAALRRAGGAAPPVDLARVEPVPGEAWALLRELLDQVLPRLGVEPERVVLVGGEAYHLPAGGGVAEGGRVLRPGWWLGTVRRGWFEPSHALAMGVHPEQASNRIELGAADPEVQAFLRGETLRSVGAAGWVLVCVDGFPLGWGKRVGSVVKNHYPRGLRRR